MWTSPAREALATLIRHEVRTELASDFEVIATELEELSLRVDVLEARAGIPNPPSTGARLRQREAVRLQRLGASVNRIAATWKVSRATVQKDLRREPRPPSPDRPPATASTSATGETAWSDPHRP